jgi:hypothetical protein
MNDELIFVKTPTGEDAVRDRTRLVQRNLRMVLIMVDGLTNVAALKHKAGDSALIETSLAELERIGLIEPMGARAARSLDMAASRSVMIDAPVHVPAEPHDNYEPADTIFVEIVDARPPESGSEDTGPIHAPDPVPPPQEEPRQSLLTSLSNSWDGVRQRWTQAQEERTYEKAYGKPSRLDIDSNRPSWSEPPRRRKRNLRPLIYGVMLGVLALGALRVVFYPYEEYRPAIEARLTKMLDDDVKVGGDVKLVFSPQPALVLGRVSVGSKEYATADNLRLVLDPRSLIGGLRFREAVVEGGKLRPDGFPRLVKWFAPGTMGDVQVGRVEVRDLALDVGWTTVGGLTGTANADDQRGFSGLVVSSAKGDFRAEITPLASGLHVEAKASQWTAPFDPPLTVSSMDFSGTLSPARLLIDKVEMRAYDGLITGAGVLKWHEAPTMSIDLVMQRLAADKLLEALRVPALLAGELSGKAQLTTSPPSAAWLGRTTRVEGAATVAHGNLKRLDLAGAMKSGGGGQARTTPLRGGETGFVELTGKYSLDAGQFRVSAAKLSSGLMLATGQTTILRQTGAMTGTANVEMRGSASAPRALVTIAGSATAPELRTTR